MWNLVKISTSERLIQIIKEKGLADVSQTLIGLAGENPVRGKVWLWGRNGAPDGWVRAGCKMNPYNCPLIRKKKRSCDTRYPSDQGIISIINQPGTMLTYCGEVVNKFIVDRLRNQAKRMGSGVA